MASVIVVGSANVDTAVRLQDHPKPGETVLADTLGVGAGGKGLNQAIASARSGARTRFVGAVGSDAAAGHIRATLEAAGVAALLGSSTQPTGAAFVMVATAGENAIVVVPGANADSPALTDRYTEASSGIDASDVVLVQLESPLEVVQDVMRDARSRGARTVLNAAPSRPLPVELLASTDVLIVNEHECLHVAGPTHHDVEGAALALAAQVGTVVVTLGGQGALTVEASEVTRYAAHSVAVADTTAAGDTFCGALAAELVRGDALPAAIRFAMGAAALTVQRYGAAESIPHRADTLALLDETPGSIDGAATQIGAAR